MDSNSNADSIATEELSSLIPEELWYERLLRYGLYFGGVFQLICILAVIFLPPSASTETEKGEDSDTSDEEEGDTAAGTGQQPLRTKKKIERKKRR